MSRFCRKLLVVTLVAFHATVMACGTCLHSLPGWEHGVGGVGSASKAKPGAHDVESSLHASNHDCPVCQLHSLGQVAPELGQVPSSPLVQRAAVLVVRPPRVQSWHGPASLRAPPSLALNPA
ncbi:hypothetical protein [Singulisphaera sp. PoT]|uniref:hypothetical protein n=1 Tax=Singulisphaera sp. PoT TaxID=3411797 RepID=UPI003BF47B35